MPALSLDEFYRLLEEEQRERRYNKLAYAFPSTGEFRRELYPKHMELIEASGKYHQLGFMGGNGTGKTYLGAYITAVLSTGLYPEWWNGYHVPREINAWISGVTNDDVRGSTQKYLLGDFAAKGSEYIGTGLIPKENIVHIRPAQNGNGLCDFATVRHKNGGLSKLEFKSYKEGREQYQAANIDWAWNDEECPPDIYGEIVQRFRGETKDGRCLNTLTPLKGRTEFALKLINWREANAKEGASRYCVFISQREVPHMTDEEINRKLAESKPWERKARETGIPSVGTGLVYPVEESKFVIPPFKIPAHYRRMFGFDYGYHNTAVVWIAIDDDTDTTYAYKDYKDGDKPLAVHASAIKSQGVWIPGVGDVSDKESDGQQIVDKYRAQGVRIRVVKKGSGSVKAGIEEMYNRLEEGKAKVFGNCSHLIEEIRLYAFDENGNIVKKNDHCLDAWRYAHTNLGIAATERRVSYSYQQAGFG